MRFFRQQLQDWIERGEPFALATIVRVEGSTPRPPGATLLISATGGRFAGSVSAGCLDNEVIQAAAEVLASGRHRVLHFGPDGVPPWQDGLSCGGRIELRLDPWFGCIARPEMQTLAGQLREWLRSGTAAVLLSRGDRHFGFDLAGQAAGDREAFAGEELASARSRLENGGQCSLEVSGASPAFVRPLLLRARLVLIGAVDTAVHLVAFARHAGFECIVLDPRQYYAQPERFAVAPDRLVQAWPQDFAAFALNPRDAALVLTHDPKIDDPALLALLRTRVGYIGALGSQRSHASRRERLKKLGAAESAIDRIEGPAGLRLGAADAVGIALGMLAGIVRDQAARGVWS